MKSSTLKSIVSKRGLKIFSIFFIALLLNSSSMSALANKRIKIKPATEKDGILYRAMGGAYICQALVEEIEFAKAVRIAAFTNSSVIYGHHGGVIAPLGKKKLENQEIYDVSVNQVLLGAYVTCPDKLPEDLRNDLKKQVEKLSTKKKK